MLSLGQADIAPSVAGLAGLTGLSEPVVRSALRSLAGMGLVCEERVRLTLSGLSVAASLRAVDRKAASQRRLKVGLAA